MRKFKRVILLCLAVLMGLSFAACGAGSETEPTEGPTLNPTDGGTVVPTDGATQAPTSEATQAPTATQGTTNGSTTAPTTAPTTSSPVAVEGEGAVLWQVAVKDALTMSYVVKTKNNKIIVIDGGGDSNSGTYGGKKYPKNEINELLKVLKEATGEQVPTIDAWILTHCHSDHINVFSHLVTNTSGVVNVGKVYYNFPSDQYLYNAGFTPGDETSTFGKFKTAIAKLSEDQLVVVEQGQSYTVDNVTFNIILTPDETITDSTFLSNAINESSIVFDMKLGGQRVLFLGDLGPYSGSRFLRAMKDTGSQYVDVVQMAHHGSQGIPMAYYWQLRPKACLWPTPDWLWENDNGGGYNSGPWETIKIYDFLTKKGVEHHYIMKDGTIKLEFPLDLD